MVTLLSSTNSAQYTQGQEHNLQKLSCIRLWICAWDHSQQVCCEGILASQQSTKTVREGILASQQSLTHWQKQHEDKRQAALPNRKVWSHTCHNCDAYITLPRLLSVFTLIFVHTSPQRRTNPVRVHEGRKQGQYGVGYSLALRCLIKNTSITYAQL